MKPKEHFTKGIYKYKLVHYEVVNNNTWAVYSQHTTWNGDTEPTLCAYETHKLRPREYHPIFNKANYPYKHPSDNDWGRYGWTTKSITEAKSKIYS